MRHSSRRPTPQNRQMQSLQNQMAHPRNIRLVFSLQRHAMDPILHHSRRYSGLLRGDLHRSRLDIHDLHDPLHPLHFPR